MTDLNKLRSEFESNEYIKSIIQNFEWSEEFNNYQIKDCVVNGNIFDLLEAKNDEQLLNGAWFGWQEKAKAQAVLEGYIAIPIESLKEALGWWGSYVNDSWKDEWVDQANKHYDILDKILEERESGDEG